MTLCYPRHERLRKPVVGVLCCNEVHERAIQAVATRFIEPLVSYAGVTVVLIPAVADAFDAASLVDRLDGLLLTGSRSNVCGSRYGAPSDDPALLDADRDEVALELAGRMIESGRSVFGICRGLQELNVLFGGTLKRDLDGDHHCRARDSSYEQLFDHRHDVDLKPHGWLAASTAERRLTVNSVHHQGVDRLGDDLRIEAVSSDDGLIEAFSANPCGGQVLAVQWHPEWDAAHCRTSRTFFELIGNAVGATCEPALVRDAFGSAYAGSGR